MLDVLAIGAHPDDVEIGMGAAVAKMVDDGLDVGILDLTNGEPTPFGSPEERAEESQKAAKILGVQYRKTLDLPNRYLFDSVEARQKVAEVIRIKRPRVLFVHYWEDAHPDHVQAAQLCEAARFYAKLTKTDMEGDPFYPRKVYHFFSTHYRIHPDPDFVMDVSDTIDRKMASLRAYHTQFVKGRENGGEGFLAMIEDRARYWGQTVSAGAGEPFVSRELIGVSDLRGLL